LSDASAGPAAGNRRALRTFGGLSFAYFAAIGLFNPYSPLWLQSLGFSTLAIGGIASLQSWTRVVVPYAWSWIGDHSGQRVALLRLAALGTVLSAAALYWTRDYAAVALVVVLLFAFNGALVPLSEAAVARYLGPGSDAGQGFDAGRYGRVRVWGSIGFIVAVLVGGAVLQRLGVQAFPLMVLALNALLLLAAWRIPRVRDQVVHDSPTPPVLPLLRRPLVAWFFASVGFTVLAHSSLYAFFSLFLEDQGYGKSQVGLLWAVSIVLEVAFFWWQGRWFHRLSSWGWLQVAAVATALRFALLALAGDSPAVLVLTQMSHALTFAAHHAACTSLLHRHFPGRLRGRGQALYATLGYGLPGILGGVGGGWIIERAGYPALFGAASLAGALAWVCVRRGQRHVVAREEMAPV
jgi:MFS transporter, PPP family, 3-phenylpropionic acid transporter